MTAALGLLLARAAGAGDKPPDWDASKAIQEVTFSRYSPLSSTAEIMRRLTTPLTAASAMEEAQRTGRTLAGQTIDLEKERFLLYVPKPAPDPAQAYALLVFVPPWPKAQVPGEWRRLLDRHHMIMVSAENSGNDASPLGRRVPLALLALENLRNEFPVDARRIFVGGFSGGSRIALRLLVGYPDQFRGALLNAGSDPVGSRDLPLPPQELLAQVQESRRLVYVTGERDEPHLVDDMHSRGSLKRWCIFDVVTLNEPRRAHEPADASDFGQALDALLLPREARMPDLEACREHLKREVDDQLDRVAALFAHGDAGARRALEGFDAEFGGLGAPRSVELARH